MGANDKVAATFHGVDVPALLNAIEAVKALTDTASPAYFNWDEDHGYGAAMGQVRDIINEQLGES